MFCTECGATMSANAANCPSCGAPNRAIKGKSSKTVFVLLAILLGGLGIHRFYLGGDSVWLGILYLVFCWTGIPAVIALFEAIIIGFRKNDPRFA